MGNNLVPASYTIDKATGRLVRARQSSGAVLCLDTSISMEMIDGFGDRRRIDVEAGMLVDIIRAVQLQACIAFSSEVRELPLSGNISIPEPGGTTAMHLAMQWALDQETTPSRIVFISDGEPDEPDACLRLAARCRERGIKIDAYYAGPADSDRMKGFMSRLAAADAPGGYGGAFKLTGPDADKAAKDIVLRIAHQQK